MPPPLGVSNDAEAQQVNSTRVTDALRFLADASLALSQSLDSLETIKAVARVSLRSFADWCNIHLVAEDGSLIRAGVVHRDPAKEEFAAALHQRGADLSQVTAVIDSGEPRLIRIITPEMLAALPEDRRHLVSDLGLRSAILAPLIGRGACIGCVSFVREERSEPYDEFDVQIAMEFGQRAAFALENARLFERLALANKAKDEFLGLISHELRTPLTGVVGFSDLLVRRLHELKPEETMEVVTALSRDAIRLHTLIDNLLVLARFETASGEGHEPMMLQHALRQVADLHRERYPARHVVVRTTTHLPPVIGRPAWVGQILENLMTNAEKYSPGDGAIEVEAAELEGAVEVRVMDRGVGIGDESRAKVFDAFFRAEETAAKPGAGLGLAVVKRLVEAQGGRIACEPREGGGTVFSFTLDLASDLD